MRADKRAYVNNLAGQAEAAAVRNKQSIGYKIIKILSVKCHLPAASLVKDEQDNLLITEKKQELRWTKHFKETPLDEAGIPEAMPDLHIDTHPTEKRLLAPSNS